MLDLLILRTLRQGPLNGWDIMNRIQMVSGEVFRVIPGSLYPALHRLEAGGLVKAEWVACGEQPAREVLQADSRWEETARHGMGDMEAVFRRSRIDSARRLITYEPTKGA
jgi:DNA-binding PadR family transcriptional regulator